MKLQRDLGRQTKNRCRNLRNLFEALEQRQLLSTAHAVPSYNLSGAFVPVTLPRELAGEKMAGTVTVAVKNSGTLALPHNQKVTLRLLAHTTGKNIVLETLTGLSVGNLAAGGSKNFSFDLKKAAVPGVGDYVLDAQIVATPALKENSTGDNLVTATAAGRSIALHVAAPDLTGTLLPSSLPALVLAGDKKAVEGTLTVQVRNSGNIALPAGEQITLQVRAHNTLTGQNYVLNANPNQKYSVSKLGIGQSVDISPNLKFTGKTFPAGHYTLQALITPVQRISESSVANNLATLNAAGQPTTLVSQSTAAPDLTGVFESSTVQANANGTAGNLTITLTNRGTATLVGPQVIGFSITARQSGLSDIGVPLTTEPQHFSVRNLKVGQSATFTVVVDGEMLQAGTWMLTAGINAPGLSGPTAGNLIAVTKSGGVASVVSTTIFLVAVGPGSNVPILPPGQIVPVTPINPGNVTVVSPGPIVVDPVPVQTPAPILTGPLGPVVGSGTPTTGGDSGAGSVTTGAGNLTVGNPTGGVLTVNGGALEGGSVFINTAINSNLTPVTGPVNILNPGTVIITNGTIATPIAGSLSNLTMQFTGQTEAMTFSDVSMDVSIADGTLSISNVWASSNLHLDLSSALNHVAHLTLNGAVHTATFDVGATQGTGTLTLDGSRYSYTVASEDAGSLVLNVTPVADGGS